jgi:endonuclease YncB( thermonuclease family)
MPGRSTIHRAFGFLPLLALAACAPAAAAQTFSGYARSIDGDSLYVGDTEVRLFGIDAPEWSQTCTRDGKAWACGEAAANQLSKLVTGRKLLCEKVDIDQHGRTVAQCTAGSIDVNRTMVASGYAIAYRHYSLAYTGAEESAKANRRGLWAGKFEMPSEYRHEGEPKQSSNRQPRRAQRSNSPPVASSIHSRSQPSGPCRIKGNRGAHGWIYHVPGMPYYEQTHAEEMFCSEAEAQAAGYRRARVR